MALQILKTLRTHSFSPVTYAANPNSIIGV